MSHQILRTAASVVAVAVLLFSSAPGAAQQPSSDVTDQIREAQTMIRAEFRQFLLKEMKLSKEEEQAFWPLYERYSAEMRVITDRYFVVVAEYVGRYNQGEIDDAAANKLIDSYFKVRLEILQFRQSYVSKFREVMSGVSVARFYQLENKVQAEVDAALAVGIPLAGSR